MTIQPLSLSQRIAKRILDIVASALGLLVLWPVILIGWVLAAYSTRANGLFVHHRVGRHGKMFPMYKLRSMREVAGVTTCVTSDSDVRITKIGRILRKLKIDELPQLFNVLLGHMSLVGPRPDMPGFLDALEGEDRILLTLRPGITGPASIAFRNEDELLAGVDDPEDYSDNVIWPQKVEINKEYVKNYSFMNDLNSIWQTVFG